ncbi:hypothetical protein ACN47E_007495 [Coniothyrium glycines]
MLQKIFPETSTISPHFRHHYHNHAIFAQMSQARVSTFQWPTAAPGAPLSTAITISSISPPALPTRTFDVGFIGAEMPSPPSTPHTVHIRVTHTLTVPALPAVTALAFNLDSPPATPSTPPPPKPTLTPPLIAAIALSTLFLLLLLTLLIRYCIRLTKPYDIEAAIKAKRKRNGDMSYSAINHELQRRMAKRRVEEEQRKQVLRKVGLTESDIGGGDVWGWEAKKRAKDAQKKAQEEEEEKKKQQGAVRQDERVVKALKMVEEATRKVAERQRMERLAV